MGSAGGTTGDTTVDTADNCMVMPLSYPAEGPEQEGTTAEHKAPTTRKPPPPSPPPRAKEKVMVVDRQRFRNEQIVVVVMMNEFDNADVQEQSQQYPHPQ